MTTKGSLWRKWDFHLHTPYSVLHNEFGNPADEKTWETFVLKMEEGVKKYDISAIGLTDYFMIEGYKKIRQLIDERKFPEGLSKVYFFPNIEFRADQTIYVKRSGGKTEAHKLNFHVIFSPEVRTKDIEDYFLHQLFFVYKEDPFKTGEKRPLRLDALRELGKMLKEHHKNFEKEDDLQVGCNNAVVDLEEVKRLLSINGKFIGKYLLCLAEENTSLLHWDTELHGVRKSLLQMSHCIFSSNQNTRAFGLGLAENSSPNHVRKEFGSLKPCIWGCDSHGYNERFLCPDEERFCWIKAELSWDGLKQILYEPEERIALQKQSPEPQKSFHTIERIVIHDSAVNRNLKIKGTEIDLNENLVTFIGGRGSGKTALLDFIASFFEEGQKILPKTPSSFYSRVYANNSKNNPILLSIDTKLQKNALTKEFGKETDFIENADIRYITQNHFEGLSSDPARFNEFIFELIFADRPDEGKRFKDYEERANEKYFMFDKLLMKLKEQQSEIDQIPSIEESIKKTLGMKMDYELRLKQLEETSQINTKLNELSTQLKTAREQRMLVESAKARLEKVEIAINQADNLNKIFEDFNIEFSDKLQLTAFDLLDRVQLHTLKQVLGSNIDIVIRKLKEADKLIDDINKEMSTFKANSQAAMELKTRLMRAEEEIAELTKRIDACHLLQLEQKQIEEEMYSLSYETLNTFIEQKNFLSKQIAMFEVGKDLLLSNISFSARIEVNHEKYFSEISELVNKRQITEDELVDNIKVWLAPVESLISGEDTTTSDIKRAFNGLKPVLDGKLKARYSEFDLLKALLSVPVNVTFDVALNKTPMNKLSMGQRAIVLLQIILSYDEKPLLIDQPEEDLDNEYIYKQLVAAFRKAKRKRQIIIATHNANLVVNTDSEQVIIADCNNGEISYSVGAIEDGPTQERIKNILEGGREAFEKREEKYGYKF